MKIQFNLEHDGERPNNLNIADALINAVEDLPQCDVKTIAKLIWCQIESSKSENMDHKPGAVKLPQIKPLEATFVRENVAYGDRFYKCPHCDKEFSSANVIKRLSMTEDIIARLCPHCEKEIII